MNRQQRKHLSRLQKSRRVLDSNFLSNIFSECIQSDINSCKDKKAYENEWQAKFAADEVFEHEKVKLNWYKCEICGKWHLTKERD